MNIYMHWSEFTAVGYYRILQAAKFITRQGLANIKMLPESCNFLPLEKKDRNEYGSWEEVINWADIFVMQRRETYAQFALMNAIQNNYHKPIVYELDDDLINIDRRHPQYETHRLKSRGEVFTTITVAESELWKYEKDVTKIVKCLPHMPRDGYVDLVYMRGFDCGYLNREAIQDMFALTVTTDTLKKLYSKLNNNIYVLPNCIDFELWDKLPPVRDKRKVIIGWAGGHQHIKDFDLLCPILDQVLKKYPNACFHYCGTDNLNLRWIRRNYTTQIRRIAKRSKGIGDWPDKYAQWNFDIGLAPLWNNKFNNGKSNLKYLENAARRIPTVASNLDPYQCIKQGETGFKCNTTEEWVEALSKLIEGKDLRKRMGQNAYDHVKADYNAIDNAPKYMAVYNEILSKFKGGLNAEKDRIEDEKLVLVPGMR